MFSGGCGRCSKGLCGEGRGRGCRPRLPPTCIPCGGCFLRRRAPHFCCRPELPDCPQSCPPAPRRCGPPPIPLPLCCYKPTMESCSNDFIINAIRTACRTQPRPCSDAPCGPKGTIINFMVPNTGLPRGSPNLCPFK